MRYVAALLMTLGLASSATAQTSQEDVTYRKHTIIDFGDDRIDGETARPDVLVTDGETRRRRVKLINIRQSFRVEVLTSGQSL